MLFIQTEEQTNRREHYIKALADWQKAQHFTLFGTATFNYKNTLSEAEALKNIRHFWNVLDRTLYTHKEVLEGKRIERFVYFERGKSKTNFHQHFFCKGDTDKQTKVIERLLTFIWLNKINQTYDILIKPNTQADDRNAYCMKEFKQMDDDNLRVELCYLKQ